MEKYDELSETTRVEDKLSSEWADNIMCIYINPRMKILSKYFGDDSEL